MSFESEFSPAYIHVLCWPKSTLKVDCSIRVFHLYLYTCTVTVLLEYMQGIVGQISILIIVSKQVTPHKLKYLDTGM